MSTRPKLGVCMADITMIDRIAPLKLFRLTYEGIDDTRFDLHYRALHTPFDINDPAMDPSAAARNGPAWDSSWSGRAAVRDVWWRARRF
jgi:hypothetical protein